MAVTLEQVEILRQKADISYDEAKAVLTRHQGNLLDALVELERQGKTNCSGSGGVYSTQPKAASAPPSHDAYPVPGVTRHKHRQQTWRDSSFWTRCKDLLHAGVNILKPSAQNSFEIWRNGQMMTSMPVLILIIAVIVVSWITLPLIVFGLIFDCRYRLSGPDLNRDTVNGVLDKVSDTVHDMKDAIKRECGKTHSKKKK